jgi:AsmA-like protein
VKIGRPARIQLASVHLGTGLRALISRRVEHADVRVEGARLTLPLPSLVPGGPSTPSTGEGKPPVEIVSIDEIVLHGVEVVSGDRTLKGDIELVPHAAGVTIRRIALAAEGAAVTMTGELIALTPLSGRIDVAAEVLDIDRLVAFVGGFVAATVPAPATAVSASPTGPAVELRGVPAVSPVGQLVVGFKVGRMTTGGLTLSDFASTALVTPDAVRFEPLALGVFGGRYEGSMQLGLGAIPAYQWRAKVAGIDAASLMAFAGSPGTITGKLAGTLALQGEGLQMEQALRTARGRARIDITDGTIAGLQLVRTIVTATSGRGGVLNSAGAAVTTQSTPGAERFSRFGATLRLANGVIETDDVAMASTDVDLSAAGSLRLAGMTADLAGRAQLSEALSRQAGTDLYRYTQEGGRVTVPVTVTGPIDRLSVRVAVGDVALRALRNRAIEEARKAIERKIPGFGDLFKRPPR